MNENSGIEPGTYPDLFRHLSQNTIQCLMTGARLQRYRRGATICLEGDAATTLKLVQEGWIKLYRMSENGTEAILAALRPGQSFDEIAALQERGSPASAEAATDCAVLHIDLSAAKANPDIWPEISAAILDAASGHLDDLFRQVQRLKNRTGKQRLAAYILDLSEHQKREDRLTLPYDKHLVAGELGMQPESLSRAFSRLSEVGVTTSMKEILIEDRAALRAYVAQEKEAEDSEF